jgi:hypothetical protein
MLPIKNRSNPRESNQQNLISRKLENSLCDDIITENGILIFIMVVVLIGQLVQIIAVIIRLINKTT